MYSRLTSFHTNSWR